MNRGIQHVRCADQCVQDNHHDPKHGVAGHRRTGISGKHDGGNHHYFHPDNRQREDQCAVRFAQLDGQTIGMPHDGKGGHKDDTEKPGKQEPGFPKVCEIGEQAGSEAEIVIVEKSNDRRF
jgi:hypothetical protein